MSTYLLTIKIENVLARFEKPENLYWPKKMNNIGNNKSTTYIATFMTINNV